MKNEILANLDNPAQLEKLYRNNKLPFKQSFSGLYPELKGKALAEFWHERLSYEKTEPNFSNRKELVVVLLLSLCAGLLAKLPSLLSLDETFFYTRNVAFLVLPMLTFYFAWKNKLAFSKWLVVAGAVLAGMLLINLLPDSTNSDTLVLSCVHLPLFLWCVLCFAFTGDFNNSDQRLKFLKFNGDLVVLTALLMIACGLLTGMTIGLFSLIGFQIKDLYFQNVVIFGLPVVPILGTWLTQTNPNLVGKVSPLIARLFSPLVLVMLVIYLGAMIYSARNPYNDREFLLIFNALLIGVMAIIYFSVAETSSGSKSLPETWVLLLLSAVTILVNGIALSAIVIRIADGGFTPNRAAVLGGNVLILMNLILVAVELYRALQKKGDTTGVGEVMAGYLPVYFVWTVVVTFLFPFFFHFQ